MLTPSSAALTDPFHDHSRTTTSYSESERGPPSLNYIMTSARKRSLFITVGTIIFLNIALPTIIFYAAKYGIHPRLKPVDYYTAASAALGALQLPQVPYRFWCLLKQNGRRSPLLPDGNRTGFWWALRRNDTFQVGFLIGTILGIAVLVVATSVNGADGYFPLLVLMPAIIFGYIGLALLAVTALSQSATIVQPARFSIVPKGEPFRPALFYVWEDLVGCDGGGGNAFRNALDRRYRQSPPFRRMLLTLSWLIAYSLTGLCIVAFIITYALYGDSSSHGKYEDASWAANFVLLTLWLGLTAYVGIKHGLDSMRAEEIWWADKPSLDRLPESRDHLVS
ncbi:unnamed protein product [Tilletia controversa]|uniref:Uncharacterized protein n=2 Tax=Tilletia TaxID=13289 RepID=A0A8X7MTF3_9BASI|nr:hypothetical protein CF335_g2583 [Tilletia laevis]KAE8248341.1 hypothetical protein A4X06_0g3779 [Tilletia controversa]KAE8253487.1 hypothetical protein A4X03_0g5881 [Tilletia caries]CAD6896007.1 unnamed protein product [Tilletia controversa]CAD6977861.1 unnamed protein product [Tilletia controversa]